MKTQIRGLYNIQTIETTKIIVYLLITGAVVATIAPFLHIFFSPTSSDKIFGFRNTYMFLYAIGVHTTFLIVSLILSYVSYLIPQKRIQSVIRSISIVFISIALYHIIWIFWHKKDFNVIAYYGAIILVAIASSIFLSRLLKVIALHSLKLFRIKDKIPDLDKDITTVNHIANMMPSENDDIATYKALVDVTGDSLNDVVEDIKDVLKK